MAWEPDPKLFAQRLKRMLAKRRHFMRKQRQLIRDELRRRSQKGE